MPRPDALAPLVRLLPTNDDDRHGPWFSSNLGDGLQLIASIGAIDREAWQQIVARIAIPPSAIVSRSASEGYRAILLADAGRAGFDLETIDRVALNTNAADAWIADGERAAVVEADEPAIELACHWVLKEAYGKALGVGLALPLDAIIFHADNGIIAVAGAAAPLPSDGWQFALYRRDDRIFGIAYQRSSDGNAVGACREKAADTAAG